MEYCAKRPEIVEVKKRIFALKLHQMCGTQLWFTLKAWRIKTNRETSQMCRCDTCLCSAPTRLIVYMNCQLIIEYINKAFAHELIPPPEKILHRKINPVAIQKLQDEILTGWKCLQIHGHLLIRSIVSKIMHQLEIGMWDHFTAFKLRSFDE